MGWFDKSSRTTSTTRNEYNDNRSVVDASGGGIAGSGNVVYNDSGSTQVAEYNAQLLQALGESQADSFRTLVGGANSLYERGGQNNLKAWETTLDVSGQLFGKAIDLAAGAANNSRAVAEAAIGSFQPTDNKGADSLKWALMAGVAVLALAFFRKG
jgi:hypothetical protein